MAYEFYEAQTVKYVREQEIGKGAELTFSPFSSCIAVVVKVGDDLMGAHLSKVGFNRLIGDAVKRANTDIPFSDEAAKRLRKQFPDAPDDVLILGCVPDWCNEATPKEYKGEWSVIHGYNQLKASFKKMQNPVTVPDGQYGVKIQGGRIVHFKIAGAGEAKLPPAHLANW